MVKNENTKEKNRSLLITGFIIIVVLIASNIWTAFFYVPIKSLNNNSSGRYDLLNPARNLYDQKDLLINIQPLRDELNKIGENNKVSVYFEYLPTGANISVNKDLEFWPASLLKVPVAMAVTKKVENGIWQWNNELVMMPSDKNELFGDLYKQPLGTRLSIDNLVRLVLTESDNTANFILVRNLEPNEFQDIYNHLGLTEFVSNEGKITAKKYSIMFRSLYNSSYLSEENSQKLLAFLTETKFKEYIGSGLPGDVKFSHKIGISDDKKVFLDSGIIYQNRRPYLLTVMINSNDISFAQKTMKSVSEKVYDYVSNYSD